MSPAVGLVALREAKAARSNKMAELMHIHEQANTVRSRHNISVSEQFPHPTLVQSFKLHNTAHVCQGQTLQVRHGPMVMD